MAPNGKKHVINKKSKNDDDEEEDDDDDDGNDDSFVDDEAEEGEEDDDEEEEGGSADAMETDTASASKQPNGEEGDATASSSSDDSDSDSDDSSGDDDDDDDDGDAEVNNGANDEQDDDAVEAAQPSGRFGRENITPEWAYAHLANVWHNDGDVLSRVFRSLRPRGGSSPSTQLGGVGGGVGLPPPLPHEFLFLKLLPVSPSRFRPAAKMGEMIFENNRTIQLQVRWYCPLSRLFYRLVAFLLFSRLVAFTARTLFGCGADAQLPCIFARIASPRPLH